MQTQLSNLMNIRDIFQTLQVRFPDGKIDRSPLSMLPDGQLVRSPAESGTVEAVRTQQEYVVTIQDARVLTPELARVLPPLYANETVHDPLVIARFFNPGFSWTWYVTEGSFTDKNGIMIEPGEENEGGPEDFTFFGLVQGIEEELGYFTLLQFQEIEEATGLCMERDLYFQPVTLSQLRQRLL